MKKVLALILSFVLVLSSFSCIAYAEDEIKIMLNGNSLTMDQPPVIVDGRTLVPLRAIFEALGAIVSWDDAAKTAKGTLGTTEVSLQIDNKTAKVNGKDVALDVPAQIINSRTLVPVRFISESLGLKVDWNGDTKTVIITSNENVLTFDNIKNFQNNIDFVAGGAYNPEKISLTNEKNHTFGNGKSILLKDRQKTSHRLKLANFFNKEDIGKTYEIGAYVFTPESSYTVRMGIYGEMGSEYAYVPIALNTVKTNSDEWAYISVLYTVSDNGCNMLGFDQKDGADVAPVIYIDDISKKEIVKNEAKNEDFSVKNIVTNGVRPVPDNFKTGSSYDEITYYDDKIPMNTIKFEDLPKGDILVSQDEFLNASVMGSENGEVKKIKTENMPFEYALNCKVNNVPEFPYNYQLTVDVKNKFEIGDNCLLKFKARIVDGGERDTGVGSIQVLHENNIKDNWRSINQPVTLSSEWAQFYYPYTIVKEMQPVTWITVRLGFVNQTVEIGEFEIINYKNTLALDDMPTSENYPNIEKDAIWRSEALRRIDKIRKGDIKVIVKDINGSAVLNADVSVNMTEHDFEWGTAINDNLLFENETGKKYRETVVKYFNSAVMENYHKWVYYEQYPDEVKQVTDWLLNNGIKNFRGHVLVWENELSKWAMSSELIDAVNNKDKEKVNKLLKEHIGKMAKENPHIKDWDVANELVGNTFIRDLMGDEAVIDWFKWAREYMSDAALYLTDYSTETKGYKATAYEKNVKMLIDASAPLDGIGLQTHLSDVYMDPVKFYEQLDHYYKTYNKRIKICEYDNKATNPYVLASSIRDSLIAAFSHEAVDGFYVWEFRNGADSTNKILMNKDFSLTLGGEQFEDLVYNKWWTKENGKTDANGTFNTRGFYGDYDITVSANGKTKTVTAKCTKNSDNTVVITLD